MKNKPIIFTQLRGPSMWQFKVAKELKKRNYQTSIFLLLQLTDFGKISCNEAFTDIYTLNLKNMKPFTVFNTFFKNPLNFFKFFYKLFTIKPYVAICEGAPHYLAAIFIKIFKSRCKTIYFPYDMNYSRFKNPIGIIPNFELKGEEYAFKNCDAIMYKNIPGELNFLPKDFNVLSKPSLSFPCYVLDEWNIKYNKNKRLSSKDREIHIVSVGDMDIIPRLGAPSKEVSKAIVKQKIHYHVYPLRTSLPKSHLKEITPTKELEKYFHIHSYVLPDKLAEELSKYDFGLHPVNYSKNAKPGLEKYAGANKVASYLEASIPLIVKKSVEMYSKPVKKYKFGIVVRDDYSDVKKQIKKSNYEELIKNIYKFREQYSIKNHIHKLITFIDKLNSI